MRKITLKFFPNDRKVNPKTGKTPIYMTVNFKGVQVTKRLDWELISEERPNWNEILQRVDHQESYTNRFLDGIQLKFTQLKFSEFKDIQRMSVHEIRDYIIGNSNDSNKTLTIIEYALNYYDNNIENSSRYRKSTKQNYRKANNHLKSFVETNKYEYTRIDSLNFEFARAFSVYLMSDEPLKNRIGMSEVSACGIIKKFRTVFNQSIEEGLILKNPFKQIMLSSTSPEKQTLTISQFKELIYTQELSKTESQVVDIFLLMCFTGCAYTDCLNLTNQSTETVSRDSVRLRYTRNKTGHESHQFLSTKAIYILKKFELQPDVQTSKYLVPRITNQHMNRTLKAIANKLNINIPVTSHSARHTFRQLLDEADIVDPTVINKIMGWSGKKGMDSIYRRVTDSRLSKTKDQFEEFLNSL